MRSECQEPVFIRMYSGLSRKIRERGHVGLLACVSDTLAGSRARNRHAIPGTRRYIPATHEADDRQKLTRPQMMMPQRK